MQTAKRAQVEAAGWAVGHALALTCRGWFRQSLLAALQSLLDWLGQRHPIALHGSF